MFRLSHVYFVYVLDPAYITSVDVAQAVHSELRSRGFDLHEIKAMHLPDAAAPAPQLEAGQIWADGK